MRIHYRHKSETSEPYNRLHQMLLVLHSMLTAIATP